MNGYFYVLTAIDLFVLSFMCILTKLSESLNKKQKQGFFFAFVLIAVISVLEVVTLAVDGRTSCPTIWGSACPRECVSALCMSWTGKRG